MKNNRQYQTDARVEINKLLNQNVNPVLCMPTGSGKTYTACMIIKDRTELKERIFVLVPQEEIFDQWELEFIKFDISYGTINANGVEGKNKPVYLCMPMSLKNILSKLPERIYPHVIMTDECHTGEADTCQSIYNFYSLSKRLGLTATPERLDGRGLDNTYDRIVEAIEIKEAIESGFLTKPLLIVPEKWKRKFQDLPLDSNGEINPEMQAEIMGESKIIGDAIEMYGKVFNGQPVLVACCTYEHAKVMTEMFNKSGWIFEHIHSNLNKNERRALIRKIRTGKINGLCTVGIGIAGLDVPGLFGLIWLRRTMSLTIYLQFIGRALRLCDGKKYGIILDLVGNVFLHGTPDLKRKWSLKGRKEREKDELSLVPQMKICPICSVMNSKDNQFCHVCKFDFINDMESVDTKKRGFPTMVDGELVLLDEGELSELQKEIKEEIKKKKNAEKKESETVLKRQEKLTLLRNGLEKKDGLFFEALRSLNK